MTELEREFNKDDRFEVVDAETGKRYGVTNMLAFAEMTAKLISSDAEAGPRSVLIKERKTGVVVAEFPALES